MKLVLAILALSCLATAARAEGATLDIKPRPAEILQPVTVTTSPVILPGTERLKLSFGDSTTADTYIGEKNSQSLTPNCPADGDIRKTACTYSVSHRYKKPGTYSLTLYRIVLAKEALTAAASREVIVTGVLTVTAP